MKARLSIVLLIFLPGTCSLVEDTRIFAENGQSINDQIRSVKADIPKEEQLVAFYQATANKSLFQRDKWIIEVSDQSTTMKGDMPKIVTGKFTRKYTVYRDGDRIDSRSERSGSYGNNSKRKYATRTYQYLLLDGRVYDYQRREGLEDQPKIVVASKNLTRRVINSAGDKALALAGYMQGDLKPLAEILAKESSVIHTLPSMQMVNGFPTYVLEATTPYGQYSVWMDPNCGYSPRRVIVERGPKDLYDGRPVSTPPPPGLVPSGNQMVPRPTLKHVRFVLEISKIEEIDGDFMTTKGSTISSTVFSDGSKEESHGVCEFTLIDLDPDFNKIPDAFVLGVPDGTQVYNMDFPEGRFKWQNGKMVPFIAQPIPLLDKPLPELKDIKIDISPIDTNNKMILVCFFDMNQRPSRNCMRQLSTRARELMAKDVVVAAIQASKIDDSKLNEWVEKNNIPFPVGIVQGDEEKIRFSWGVRSLPWLILAEKEHVVTAEGFTLAELDENLMATLTNGPDRLCAVLQFRP